MDIIKFINEVNRSILIYQTIVLKIKNQQNTMFLDIIYENLDGKYDFIISLPDIQNSVVTVRQTIDSSNTKTLFTYYLDERDSLNEDKDWQQLSIKQQNGLLFIIDLIEEVRERC